MAKPQFSIPTLLLSIALIATAIALFLSRRDVAELVRQRQEIVEETGYIDVSDPEKVYVRELFCPAPLTW